MTRVCTRVVQVPVLVAIRVGWAGHTARADAAATPTVRAGRGVTTARPAARPATHGHAGAHAVVTRGLEVGGQRGQGPRREVNTNLHGGLCHGTSIWSQGLTSVDLNHVGLLSAVTSVTVGVYKCNIGTSTATTRIGTAHVFIIRHH